jgi:hypothetical protein
MLIPTCPSGQNLFFSAFRITLMVDVKQEVDEYVRVVHPTQVENDGGVVAAEPESARLDDRGDKDGECSDEDRSGLLLDHLQLVQFDFAIPKRKEGRDKAKKVLDIGGGAHAYAGYVRISRNKAAHSTAWERRKMSWCQDKPRAREECKVFGHASNTFLCFMKATVHVLSRRDASHSPPIARRWRPDILSPCGQF